MATSGSIDFSMTRDDIIKASFRKLGLLAEGEELTVQQVTDAAQDLNMMVKFWKTDGINLWCYQNITLFPVISQEVFSIGATGDKAAVDYVQTEIATAAVSGASTITVDSASGISDADNIGIELEGGSLQWTTANGSPAGAVITLTDALIDDVAVDARVYAYTSIAQRPLRVTGARWQDDDGTETPLTESSRHDYKNLSVKSSKGNPTQFYYDPQLGNGKLYLWQTFSNVRELVHLTAQRAIEDFDLSTDNPDFPQEWFLPLVYGLAAIISEDYNIEERKLARIMSTADSLYDTASGFDQEPASVQFVPYSR